MKHEITFTPIKSIEKYGRDKMYFSSPIDYDKAARRLRQSADDFERDGYQYERRTLL